MIEIIIVIIIIAAIAVGLYLFMKPSVITAGGAEADEFSRMMEESQMENFELFNFRFDKTKEAWLKIKNANTPAGPSPATVELVGDDEEENKDNISGNADSLEESVQQRKIVRIKRAPEQLKACRDALRRRSMATVEKVMILKSRADEIQAAKKNNMCPDKAWENFVDTNKAIEVEIRDIVFEAESLLENYGQHILNEGAQLIQLRNQANAQKVAKEREAAQAKAKAEKEAKAVEHAKVKAVQDKEAAERKAEKFYEQVMAEDGGAKKSGKKKSIGK